MACSEVEVDVLTGGHHIISTDIIMDVGDSLNPALDIGQVYAASYIYKSGVSCYRLDRRSLYSRSWTIYNGRTNFLRGNF